MSIAVMTQVWKRYPNGGGEMLLALALADWGNDDGNRIYPSIKQLAEKTRQSERTVQYQLRRMEESGWLVLLNEGNGGRNQRREYQINTDWLNGAEIAPPSKGAIDDIKGANDDRKGCNLLHPHITVNKPLDKPLEGGAKKPRANPPKAVIFDDWKTHCKNQGLPLIPADHSIYDYADVQGWSYDLIDMAWYKFDERYSGNTTKKYIDWRRVFVDAVKGNWFNIWKWSERDNCTVLTTQGIQLKKEMAAKK